jgi:outer membrane receptor protein involved in Fe transport
VTEGAGYVQESLSFLRDRLVLSGGLRFDEFRWNVLDRVVPAQSGGETQGRWQPKANLAFTPARSIPLTLYINYGRGINSVDARAVVQRPGSPRLATTDFYQAGAALHLRRFAFSTDTFLIDHSNEMVYIPDDGSFEFKGPSRAYGFESKISASLTRHLSLNAGLTKMFNAFFKGRGERVYVDCAPHFVADAGLTLTEWHGWNGSLRMRAINHYRLDGSDPSIVASGMTVFDMGLARRIRRGMELNLSLDNLLSRNYYETQNYIESRVTPTAAALYRIHGTPGYPLTAAAGVTFRLREK